MRARFKGTKGRILETARTLYNERGYANVTTAALAQACGIAEGNLWYHFKTKLDLLETIAEEFREDIEARLALPIDPDNPASSYALWLKELVEEQRKYRFLYRDSPHHDEHIEAMANNVPRWLARSQDAIELHLKAMVDQQLLDWPIERLHDLAVSALVILRYGLEHFSELGEPEGAVRKSLLQHLSLFEHRLSSEAAQTIRQGIEQIKDEVKAAA